MTRQSLRLVDQDWRAARDRRAGLVFGQISVAAIRKLTSKFQHPSCLAATTSTDELNGLPVTDKQVKLGGDINDRYLNALGACQLSKRITIEVTFSPMAVGPVILRSVILLPVISRPVGWNRHLRFPNETVSSLTINEASSVTKTIRPTVYDSAIDTSIALLLLLAPLVATGLGIQSLLQGHADDAMYLFLVGAGTMLLTIALTHPCRYTILEDSISIRCGILFYQVPLDEIVSVEPSSTWISGPALSMRRVKIKTNKRMIVVSPREREAFIEDLKAAARIEQ